MFMSMPRPVVNRQCTVHIHQMHMSNAAQRFALGRSCMLHRPIPTSHLQRHTWPTCTTMHAAMTSTTNATPASSAGATAPDWARVDALLATGTPEDEAAAVALVREMKANGVLFAFSAGQQVPKRNYTIEELRLNNVEPEKYLSPADNTLSRVRSTLQIAFVLGLTTLYLTGLTDLNATLLTVVGVFFALAVDQVAAQGGFEALVVDTAGRVLTRTYAQRVALHEAGHFLVAYLLGLLPRSYTLSSLDAFARSRALNVQAGTQFCDGEFQKELASGTLRSSSLSIYACVALAGVATEYLRFGQAEGGLGDVLQLDGLLQALRFTPKKAEGEVRWAVLNTTLLLRQHEAVQQRLADAMARGESVGACCALIEQYIDKNALMGQGTD